MSRDHSPAAGRPVDGPALGAALRARQPVPASCGRSILTRRRAMAQGYRINIY